MKKAAVSIVTIVFMCTVISSCKNNTNKEVKETTKIPVLFDTDANNELDDQHALAYLLLNGEMFAVEGITVNATHNGGDIEGHYKEAERVLKLCKLDGEIPLYKGANGTFRDIKENMGNPTFDGHEAVNFIIETANSYSPDEKLILLPVGKLTNIALALYKDPGISDNVRIVWLGSNYPEPGEYNQDNDTSSMNYLLRQEVPFEMVTVRYGKPSGTDAVKITQQEINDRMPGLGPEVEQPVTGRHGEAFTNFGDYSVNLFEHIDYYGDPPSRSLFDLAAVAIVKNPSWADSTVIPSPILVNNQWIEQPDSERKIVLWENFNRDKIVDDMFNTLKDYHLAKRPE